MIDIAASGHYIGDCRELLAQLPDGCVQTCVTSPPYWGLRDYGHEGQLGLEATPELYVAAMVDVFRGVRRVLREDGTLWVNLGDSYAGSRSGPQGDSGEMRGRAVAEHRAMQSKAKARPSTRGALQTLRRGSVGEYKHKDLVGIPWMVAFALRADGWYLRSDIIWAKSNPMPESVRDRPTKAHEYIFLLSKSASYFYDAAAASERATWRGQKRNKTGPIATAMPGAPTHKGLRALDAAPPATRNQRSVWTVATQPYAGAHFATFPPRLIEPCVLAGSRPNDIVLDPFFGSGTTGMVAQQHGRRYIGFDLGYEDLATERLRQCALPMRGVT